MNKEQKKLLKLIDEVGLIIISLKEIISAMPVTERKKLANKLNKKHVRTSSKK